MFASRKKSSYEKQQEKMKKEFDKKMKKIDPNSGKPTLAAKYGIEPKEKKKKNSK